MIPVLKSLKQALVKYSINEFIYKQTHSRKERLRVYTTKKTDLDWGSGMLF